MKILIIKPSSLGDVIHALPFLKAVKGSFPEAQIDWVISKNLKGLLEGNPLIHELIALEKDSWKDIKKLPRTLSEINDLRKSLKSKRYDVVVDLQGLLRSGLLASFAPSSLKIGFENAREGSRFFYDKKIPVNGAVHAVDRCLEIAGAMGVKPGKIEFPLYTDEKARDKVRQITGNIPEYILIAPSARWDTKRWPAVYFASLVKKITLPCIIAGVKGDRALAEEIIHRSQSTEHRTQTATIVNLCGRTNLKELVALIDGAKAVVSNDSGPMHVAAALNKPVVALFGPTDPEKTGPYGWQKKKNMKVVKAGVPCSPCRKKKCRDLVCMKNISVETVFEALKECL
ncbi:MAG: lipopolysaccharide heptosyltransferase I [Nitrospiraceae bacterium]|nr:MAG: lipopolysaccharide heptosyltransferase I [Nitrospiraceae bacterium]